MDKNAFQEACEAVRAGSYGSVGNGIGTLGEKTLHAVLKHYFEPHEGNHETKIGRYVADIVDEEGIIEIQTRSLTKLKPKLKAFLECCPVTVVYPVIRQKWLVWVDEETGETTKRRKSSKTGTPADAMRELFSIREFLSHPNLTLCLLLFDGEEFRSLNGWSKDRKRGSTRIERYPIELADEQYFCQAKDYLRLLPGGLPDRFTVKELMKAARLSQRAAQMGLYLLMSLGTVERKKEGNRYLYERCIMNVPND